MDKLDRLLERFELVKYCISKYEITGQLDIFKTIEEAELEYTSLKKEIQGLIEKGEQIKGKSALHCPVCNFEYLDPEDERNWSDYQKEDLEQQNKALTEQVKEKDRYITQLENDNKSYQKLYHQSQDKQKELLDYAEVIRYSKSGVASEIRRILGVTE